MTFARTDPERSHEHHPNVRAKFAFPYHTPPHQGSSSKTWSQTVTLRNAREGRHE